VDSGGDTGGIELYRKNILKCFNEVIIQLLE
jgi:hypothetical protein